jgi:dUTP pyrophosphatase
MKLKKCLSLSREKMKVKFKKTLPNAITPSYAVEGDACMDLFAASFEFDEFGNRCYDTGVAFEIPEGYVGLVFPRSSISKTTLSLRNAVAVIDSGYRGSIVLKFKRTPPGLPPYQAHMYEKSDRIGQIMIIPRPEIELEQVEELSYTRRGTGGFGSTGM